MGSFRKEYWHQLEIICYNFRKQLRNVVRSGLKQVEAAAFPGVSPRNFSSAGKHCCPPQAGDKLLGSPRRGATRLGGTRAWGTGDSPGPFSLPASLSLSPHPCLIAAGWQEVVCFHVNIFIIELNFSCLKSKAILPRFKVILFLLSSTM